MNNLLFENAYILLINQELHANIWIIVDGTNFVSIYIEIDKAKCKILNASLAMIISDRYEFYFIFLRKSY